MEYHSLNEKTAIEYVKKVGLFSQDSSLEVQEIGDGNLNMVFKIIQKDTGKTMIIKQALPYVRCVGPSWPLTLDRMRIEAEAMEVQNKYAPGLVPKIYNHDSNLAVLIMEDLSRLSVMRGGTIKMQKYPMFADHISTFMANLFFYTSDLAMVAEDKKRLVAQFINPELCRITEDLIFTDPYYDCKRNIINPALRDYLEKVFWKKKALRLEASKFKYKFITEAQSLLHGDLHTGSIFVSEQETKVFDTEFSFVGPSAFDSGLLVGNILINYFSWTGKDEPAEKRKDYQAYLLTMINDIYELFEKKFAANWQKDSLDVIATVTGYQEHYMRKMFVDTIGFATMAMVRRMHGLAHNIDVDGIKDEQRRRDVQITILEAAEELMMNREKFMNIRELTKFVGKNAN